MTFSTPAESRRKAAFEHQSSYRLGVKIAITLAATFVIAMCARQALSLTQNETDFPQGYDAVTAAPGSHRVIFENTIVRVLEVTMPPPGKTEPMHHHHWPGFFLDWDTGARMCRITRVAGRFTG
jgi:hypothetical protein